MRERKAKCGQNHDADDDKLQSVLVQPTMQLRGINRHMDVNAARDQDASQNQPPAPNKVFHFSASRDCAGVTTHISVLFSQGSCQATNLKDCADSAASRATAKAIHPLIGPGRPSPDRGKPTADVRSSISQRGQQRRLRVLIQARCQNRRRRAGPHLQAQQLRHVVIDIFNRSAHQSIQSADGYARFIAAASSVNNAGPEQERRRCFAENTLSLIGPNLRCNNKLRRGIFFTEAMFQPLSAVCRIGEADFHCDSGRRSPDEPPYIGIPRRSLFPGNVIQKQRHMNRSESNHTLREAIIHQ